MEKVKLRNRKSSHRIALVFIEKWNPKSTEMRTLYIRYKFGSSSPKYKTTTFQARMSEWDKKEQSLKNKEDHIKLSEWIAEFKKKKEDVSIQLSTGDIDLETAFAILFGKSTTGSVLTSVSANGKRLKKSKTNIKKVTDYISAIETGLYSLGYKHYNTINFEHLSNYGDRQNIEDAIIDQFDIKNNTKNSYLKALGYAWEWNPDTKGQIFTKRVEADEYIPKEPVSKRKFNEGVLKIGDNSQWFEAYLFWLLSFSLRGINGADICIMNEDWLSDEFGDKTNDLKHYLPDMHKLYDTKGQTFTKKLYLTGKRVKTDVRLKILFNQYPTLLILNLLKRMVKHNRPDFAYYGKDPIKIYNIDYFTDRGKKDWKNVLGTYSEQFKKMTGYTISTARNTFTDVLKNHLQQEGDMLSVSLGHRPSKATHHKYANISQERLDILHIEVLRIFNVNEVLKLMYQVHKDKTLSVITNLEGSDFGAAGSVFGNLGWFSSIHKEEIKALDLPLTNWDWRKEDELQKLLGQQDMMSAPEYNAATGKLEYKKDESRYPKVLRDLIKEKENILKERYNEMNKDYTINFNTKTQKVEIIDKNSHKVVKLDNEKRKSMKEELDSLGVKMSG